MLSEDELRSLIAKYDEKRNGMVNYKSFCDVIDSSEKMCCDRLQCLVGV